MNQQQQQQQQQNFHYEIPQDMEEDDLEEDVDYGDAAEDQEAQFESNQAQHQHSHQHQHVQKFSMNHAMHKKQASSASQFVRIKSQHSDDGLMQENSLPNDQQHFAPQTDPDNSDPRFASQQHAMQENAYQIGADQVNFQAKQIQNQLKQPDQYFPVERLNNDRIRPQSAKVTTSTQERTNFGAQMRNQQQIMLNLTNQQSQASGGQWYASASQAQQQRMLNSGYSQQTLGSVFYPQAGIMLSTRQGGKSSGRRRPGTAGRKAKLTFGTKLQGLTQNGQSSAAIVKAASVANLNLQSVAKLRPKVVQQERERLFDDVMKQKMATNNLYVDNTRLRTRLHMLEVEMQKKDKIIDDLMSQQEQNQNAGYGLIQPTFSAGQRIGGRLQNETHLVINLKRKIKDLNVDNQKKVDEIEALKKNIRSTQLKEIETEIKVYIEECARLRKQLEDVMRSKDTFADPIELKTIQEQFQERDKLIEKLQQDNGELQQLVQNKDEENGQLINMIQDMDRRIKKVQAAKKTNLKIKKDVKEKDNSAFKMRKEINELKSQNSGLAQLVKEFKNSQLLRQPGHAPRVSSGNSQQQAMSKQGEENRRLYFENSRLSDKMKNLEAQVRSLQEQLQQKEEELTITNSDKVRFKEISEKYMQEVTHLEQQLEAAAIKPKSKASQRPKDTAQRDITQSLSNISAQKVKIVEPKQLKQEVQLIKLFLQQKFLQCDHTENLAPVLFSFEGSYDPYAQMSIKELRAKFEDFGLQSKKCVQLARYLVENNQNNQQSTNQSGEVLYNENLTAETQAVLVSLQSLIGHYYLYKQEGSEFDQDYNFLQEEYMQKLVYENFNDCRDVLLEALKCEDYEDQGLLELSQLLEAISTVNEELEPSIMDYMLYFVYVRSENHEQMQYKHLIDLIDQMQQMNENRVQSSDRKNRPESASPETLKKRNQQQQKSARHDSINDDANQIEEEEDYPEEEIAVDPDDNEDDGTEDQVEKVDKLHASGLEQQQQQKQQQQQQQQQFFTQDQQQLLKSQEDNLRYSQQVHKEDEEDDDEREPEQQIDEDGDYRQGNQDDDYSDEGGDEDGVADQDQDQDLDDLDQEDDDQQQQQPEEQSEMTLKMLPQDSSQPNDDDDDEEERHDQSSKELLGESAMEQEREEEEGPSQQEEQPSQSQEDDLQGQQDQEEGEDNQQDDENDGENDDGLAQGAEEDDEEQDDDEEEIDEEEVIDVAERIFIRIAEEIIKQDVTSIRELFQDQLFEAEISGQILELLTPQGMIDGIKSLGIDDLSDKEIQYLLRVLTKPELEGAIVMQELLQIMENLGLYDESQAENEEGNDEEVDEYGNTSRSDPTAQADNNMGPEARAQQEAEEAKVEAFIQQEQEQEQNQQQSQQDQEDEEGEEEMHTSSLPTNTTGSNKKKSEALDLSKLDQKSVKIMIMLMVHLLQQNQTTQEFFLEVLFEQKVKTKTKLFTMTFLKSEDFFRVLKEKGIRSKDTEHVNLREFLQLSANNPQLLLLKNIRKTLEQMSENEAFMSAIQEDVLMSEQKEQEEMDLQQIENGQGISSEYDDEEEEDEVNDGRPDEEESKLNTVDEKDGEGTSNQDITTNNEKYSASQSMNNQQLQTGFINSIAASTQKLMTAGNNSSNTVNNPAANIPVRLHSEKNNTAPVNGPAGGGAQAAAAAGADNESSSGDNGEEEYESEEDDDDQDDKDEF